MSIEKGDQSTCLARWKCHKEVHAAQIKSIEYTPFATAAGATLKLFCGADVVSMDVSEEYVRKHAPHAGGYLVAYDDGYMSFSPAKAFEAGYTRIK